jgi:KDO2-lipid IV(A) lauroyltransferase
MIPQDGKVSDAIQHGFFHFLRLLPTEWTSAIGSFGYRLNGRLARQQSLANLRNNLRHHRPDASEEDIEGWISEFYDAVGRVAAEFAVLHRFLDEGRISVLGMDGLKSCAGTKPIVALCVHTGNWEVFSPVFQQAGIKLNSIIQTPASKAEEFIVDRTRRLFNVNPIFPDLGGTRQAIRILKANGLVSMFPDEARNGWTMGPLFGRPPHDRGNLAIAAKLARMTGASFVLGHCRRVEKCRFELNFSPIFDLPERDGVDALADVAFLNDWIEPVIQREIPRWYFLDDSIAPVTP